MVEVIIGKRSKIMNLKDRGLTVGDLIVVVVIIVSTIFVVKNINKDSSKSLNFTTIERISLQ